MTDDVAKALERNASLFETHLKPLLLREWGGDIVSLEGLASNPLAELFDKATSSDLILSYVKTKGPTVTVAIRMAFSKPEDGSLRSVKFSAWDLDFTFRCSYPDSSKKVGFDCELEKLLCAQTFNENQIQAVFPFLYVKARFAELPSGFRLYDYSVVETRCVLEILKSPTAFDWYGRKQRWVGAGKPMDADRTVHDEFNRTIAGIRFNSSDGKGFVFLTLKFLERHGVPYLYRRTYGDQSRIDGSLFTNRVAPSSKAMEMAAPPVVAEPPVRRVVESADFPSNDEPFVYDPVDLVFDSDWDYTLPEIVDSHRFDGEATLMTCSDANWSNLEPLQNYMAGGATSDDSNSQSLAVLLYRMFHTNWVDTRQRIIDGYNRGIIRYGRPFIAKPHPELLTDWADYQQLVVAYSHRSSSAQTPSPAVNAV